MFYAVIFTQKVFYFYLFLFYFVFILFYLFNFILSLVYLLRFVGYPAAEVYSDIPSFRLGRSFDILLIHFMLFQSSSLCYFIYCYVYFFVFFCIFIYF